MGGVGLPGLIGDRGDNGPQVWHFHWSVSDSPLECHTYLLILYTPLVFKGPAGADGGPGTDGTRGVKVSKKNHSSKIFEDLYAIFSSRFFILIL